MNNNADSQAHRLQNAALIKLLGTAGLVISATPILSLLLARSWAQPGRWPSIEAAHVLALSSLVLPLLSCAGCLACLASLALMQQRWREGWERALLGLLLGGLVLGYWAGLIVSGVGLQAL